jgi:bla regulator protein blaR1
MMVYLIKVIFCSAFLLFFYLLFLEKEKIHHFNRFYLLLSLAFSILAPLLPIHFQTLPVPIDTIPILPAANANNPGQFPLDQLNKYIDYSIATAPSRQVNASQNILPVICFIITAFLFIRFAKNIGAIIIRVWRHKKVEYQGAQLVLVHDKQSPCSFFNYIFLNEGDYKHNRIRSEV